MIIWFKMNKFYTKTMQSNVTLYHVKYEKYKPISPV